MSHLLSPVFDKSIPLKTLRVEVKKKSRIANSQQKKSTAEMLFRSGKTDPKELAEVFGVSYPTICRWIKAGNWKQDVDELLQLDKELEINAKKLLLEKFKTGIKSPDDRLDIQSLNSLYKEIRNNNKPSKEYLDYVIKFQEQFKEFCHQNQHTELWEMYRGIGKEFSEFLREANA